MELRPDLAVRQQTVLSPRLYQSMRILRLGAHELLDLIQKELEENPALEMPEPSDYDLDAGMSPERQLWEDCLRSSRVTPSTGDFSESRLDTTDLTASPVSLSDHLSMQLALEDLTPDRYQAGLEIIGSLDDDGYLRDSIERIAGRAGVSTAEAEAVLDLVQRFDPPGVAARDLEECLLIQLRQMGGNQVAEDIVRSHLPEVARNAFARIARELRVPAARIEQAVAMIRELNPAPGSLFDTDPPAGPVIPDVFTCRSDERVEILPNRDILPPLKLSKIYREMAAAKGSVNDETADYLKKKTREAARLISDIRQRRTTISKVARAIAEAQPDFFEKGPAYLRPLSIESVARQLDVHPSTISRAILGKYMNTPFGIFEFRYFFSAGYSASGGKKLAANAVKKRISELITGEDPSKPLSDQKIVEMLLQEQIRISRRTIAKYREEMGILPSWQRKKTTQCGSSAT